MTAAAAWELVPADKAGVGRNPQICPGVAALGGAAPPQRNTPPVDACRTGLRCTPPANLRVRLPPLCPGLLDQAPAVRAAHYLLGVRVRGRVCGPHTHSLVPRVATGGSTLRDGFRTGLEAVSQVIQPC
ncbi:hypothetical protein NDU88_006190 [Pleurodeles waltl]|uniref:Uncharacterized protein n=1 Tax=Pleurodeles waltl TaxID=8319 RepID=A0AAV7UK94_PLEWA|nr:hypothetical protein NDU88_006190 [Pleurodeles waltl]